MASVADPRPRAKRTRRPAADPSVTSPAITSSVPEGWQPGGRATVATVATPPAPARPAVRHGTCGVRITIGGNEYRVSRGSAPPPFEGVVLLRKIGSDPATGPVTYAIATDGLDVHCTCPDHAHNKTSCKHMMALAAIARIFAPFAEGGAL